MSLAAAVNLMPEGPPGRVAEVAAHAEQLGFTRCWVYDEGLATRDVYVTLAAVATATSTITIGPGITNPFTRHPGVTASAVAAIDELSDGRAFMGLGAGGGLTLGPMAIERYRPLRAVEEMAATTRALWQGEVVDLDGETLRYRGARLVDPRPRIEIHLAGRGPRMIELAGRIADGFYLSFIHKGLLGGVVARLRSARTEPITLTYSTRLVLTDADFEAARRDLSFRLPDSPADVHSALDMTSDDIDRLRAALADGGPPAAAALVRDDWVRPFVITGTADECSQELQDLTSEHGIDEFLVPVADIDTAGDVMAAAASIVAGR